MGQWPRSGKSVWLWLILWATSFVIFSANYPGPSLPTALKAKAFMVEDMSSMVSELSLKVSSTDTTAKFGAAMHRVEVPASLWPPLGGKKVTEALERRGWLAREDGFLCKNKAKAVVRVASSTEDGMITMLLNSESIRACQ